MVLLTPWWPPSQIWWKSGPKQLQKNSVKWSGTMMLFVTILSKEVSSTGSIPGENEWTPTHGAAPTQCAPKMTPMLLSQPPIPAPAAKTFSETISISQSIIQNSSTIFSSRWQKIFFRYDFIEKRRIKFHLVIQILGRKRRLPRSLPGAWMHFHNERPKNRKNGRR